MLLSSFRRAFAIPVTCVLAATGTYLAAGCSSRPGTDSTADNRAAASTPASPPQRRAFTFGASYGTTVAAEQAGHQWAPATSAAITPGIQTYTQGAVQCTANYVFVDDTGHVYIGQAAHCATTAPVTDTDGCTAGSLPLGTAVSFNRNSPVSGAPTTAAGQLAYSSWLTMQEISEKDRNTCAYNDFALVRLAPQDTGTVNPSLPHWGGPVGINTSGTNAGDRLYSYWNSILRGGIASLSPQVGESKIDDAVAGGWTHAVVAPIPGIPGDSGSAFLDHDGYALGTLSTLAISLPIVNNVGDISHELAYARAHSGISGLRLVLGTEPFTPNR